MKILQVAFLLLFNYFGNSCFIVIHFTLPAETNWKYFNMMLTPATVCILMQGQLHLVSKQILLNAQGESGLHKEKV